MVECLTGDRGASGLSLTCSAPLFITYAGLVLYLQVISDEIYQMKQPDKITPKPPEQILCDEEYITTPIIGNEILNINHDFEFDTIQNFF